MFLEFIFLKYSFVSVNPSLAVFGRASKFDGFLKNVLRIFCFYFEYKLAAFARCLLNLQQGYYPTRRAKCIHCVYE